MTNAQTTEISPDYFAKLFADSDDPWSFRSRWYEERKRALTLACLPKRRYESGYEPGCANGELSAVLATRCDRLLVSDGEPAAVEIARKRLADFKHVSVRQAWVPDEWPQASFDLIVISELAYYLDAQGIDRLAAAALKSLLPGGVVLACHWRAPIEGCVFNGDEVNRRLGDRLALPQLSQLIEKDCRIDVWCADERSVAQHEGLI